MKRIGMFVLLGLAAGMAAAVWAEDTVAARPPLAQFDQDVAVCRRVVRKYCAIVQKMTPQPAVDEAQQAEGLRLLRDARKQWTDIQSKYGANPPAEYARDKAFKARLQDVANSMQNMEEALAAGDARRSFQACGFGCSLFVQMHEQNGLNYAIDKLFHLRADIKTTEAVMKIRGMDAVRTRLPGLLQKRDAVLLAPPPFTAGHEKHDPYFAAVDRDFPVGLWPTTIAGHVTQLITSNPARHEVLFTLTDL